jgi:hypothetical protein
MLQVFAELAKIGPAISPDEEQSSALRNVPYRRTDTLSEPHPGLRAYPFLAQVQSLHSAPQLLTGLSPGWLYPCDDNSGDDSHTMLATCICCRVSRGLVSACMPMQHAHNTYRQKACNSCVKWILTGREHFYN